MASTASLALLLLLPPPTSHLPPQQRVALVKDSVPADSITRETRIRRPVTAQVLASAFRDQTARNLFYRARAARIAQDSSLTNYAADVRRRMSVSGGIGKYFGERLMYRSESASRVRWQRGVGARIEMTGARISAPVLGSEKIEREAVGEEVLNNDLSIVPYFPGSETLWAGELPAQADVNERGLVHPLATGAEAYYTYKSGDSVTFRLPDNKTVRLRELEVRPREPKWNLTVGSLWFDVESGQLVRAAFRLAAPASGGVSVTTDDSTSKGAKVMSYVLTALMSPNQFNISAVAVEYGLYGGRFWLPRQQFVEGAARLAFGHVAIRMENSFGYSSVNGPMDMAAIAVDTSVHDEIRLGRAPAGLTLEQRRKWRDSAMVVYRARVAAREDSAKKGFKFGSWTQCDSGTTRTITRYRYDEARVPVEMRAPCSIDSLIHSPTLPASAYDPGEDVFGGADRERLIGDALSFAAQSPLALGALPMPRMAIGPSMTRYNKVEGFSTGIALDQQLGAGMSANLSARFGFADRIPDVQFSLARSNLSETIRVAGYRRLVSANDWGNPLSFSSSMSAILFGRDEGFYYRASGAELLWSSERGARLDWRVFLERQGNAKQNTLGALGPAFGPNITAAEGKFAGAGVRFLHTYGADPRRLRAFVDLRLEGAGGDSTYGRGALDVTLSRDLFAGFMAGLTAAGGTSVGDVPIQRRWYLGGTQTIRGLVPDTARSGTAFWLGRAELARGRAGFKASVFADVGWVGDRTQVSTPVRPLSGAGVGFSALDGLIRFDVARGVQPRTRTRLTLYMDARF